MNVVPLESEALARREPDMPALIVSGYAEVGRLGPHLPRLAKPFLQQELAAELAKLVPERGADR